MFFWQARRDQVFMSTMDPRELQKLLDIGIALSANEDSDSLMRDIVDVAMKLTNCDGGTLYILEGDELIFYIMVTISLGIDQGGHGQKIPLPPVSLKKVQNVCAKAAVEKQLISVEDVYRDERFDFTGPLKYDRQTGYRTQSMLVIPMMDDKGDTIGVLQLLNAKDQQGQIVPFRKEVEQVILSLASQAAIRLTTLNYSREITKLLESIVQVLSTAIDARTPYNANHTKNMARYAEQFLDWLKATNHPKAFSAEEEKEFLMAVWFHDLGKLVTPLEVMDKSSRLGGKVRDIEQRFENIELLEEVRYLRNESTEQDYREMLGRIKSARETIEQANTAGFLQDELYDRVKLLTTYTYKDREGVVRSLLTKEEQDDLLVRKGTLTNEERKIMESHVVLTNKLLSQMHFGKGYSHVLRWASNHHEYLDGSGYPAGITAAELDFPERLLTILDIYDALTAKDRPYKKAMPRQKALDILKSMAGEGKIDGEILELFMQSGAGED